MNPYHPLSRLPNPYRPLFPLRVFLLGHRMVFINIIPHNSPRRFQGIQRSGDYTSSPRIFQGFQRSGIGRMPNNPGTPRLANQSQNIAATPELLASRALVMFLIQHLRNRPQPQRMISRPILLETALDNQSYEMKGFARLAYSYEKQCLRESFRFYFLHFKNLEGFTRKCKLAPRNGTISR